MTSSDAALVQTRFETIDPVIFEQVLAQATALPRAEIMRIARRQRGILHERLPPDAAAEVVQRLTQHNVGVVAVPAASLPEISKPRNALWLEPDASGFGVPLDHRQIIERIDWLSVFAIHADLLPDPQAKPDKVAASLGSGAIAEAISNTGAKLTQRFPNVDVVGITDAGKLVHFRIAQTRFAPRRMPWLAPDRPLSHKFYELLRLLIEQSTAAIISPTARRMLLERPSNTHTLSEQWLEEMDERAMGTYMRWLVWLAMHREQQMA